MEPGWDAIKQTAAALDWLFQAFPLVPHTCIQFILLYKTLHLVRIVWSMFFLLKHIWKCLKDNFRVDQHVVIAGGRIPMLLCQAMNYPSESVFNKKNFSVNKYLVRFRKIWMWHLLRYRTWMGVTCHSLQIATLHCTFLPFTIVCNYRTLLSLLHSLFDTDLLRLCCTFWSV